MKARSLFLALFLLFVSFSLWGAYGYFLMQVESERSAYEMLLSDVALRESREQSMTKLRGTVRDSREDRDLLERLMQTDVIPAVATIEAAGAATGVSVKIDGATSASSNEYVRSIVVNVSATGKRDALLKALMLFETLPFPSVVSGADLMEDTGSAGRAKGDWTLRTQIRFVTTSSIGS